MTLLARLSVLLLVAGCAAGRTSAPLERELTLALPTLEGDVLSLQSMRGKVVLVEVWASWCRPCLNSLPFHADLHTALRPRGFEFVGINIDADERAAVAFLDEARLEVPTLRDPGGVRVAASLPLKRLPMALLLDRRGRIRYIHEGFHPKDRAHLRSRVEALLGEPSPD